MYLPMTRWQRPSCAQAGAKRGVEREALLVELARRGKPVVGPRQLVRAEVELVGAGVVRRVGRRRGIAPAERQRQRLDDAAGDVVLQRKRSPSDDWTVCEVSSVPPGASTSCAVARS